MYCSKKEVSGWKKIQNAGVKSLFTIALVAINIVLIVMHTIAIIFAPIAVVTTHVLFADLSGDTRFGVKNSLIIVSRFNRTLPEEILSKVLFPYIMLYYFQRRIKAAKW